jgi:hypothetical protein
MSGKNSRMNPLELRKQILIAENKINRAQLVRDWRKMTDKVHVLTERARTIGSLASSAVSLVTSIFSRSKKPAPANEKLSWLQNVMKGAQMAGSLWSEFHS